jgi:uncharacterized protein (TIGR02246 family)
MTSLADEKDAIREQMARYCYALDACRFGDVAALFADDGEWTTSYGSARGRAEIAALLDSNVPKPGEGPQRKHYITNIIVQLDGDRATATSDYLVVREGEGGLLPVMGGRYKDAFVKRGDMALKNGR